MTRKFHQAAIVVAALVVLGQSTAFADDKDVIDYRQHIMKTLDEQAGAMGQILSSSIPSDNFAVHIEAIALAASTALKSFEAKVPGGESKPEVWSNWPDFQKRMTAFADATAKLAVAAKKGGQEAIMNDLVGALACKECHDLYRTKK